MPAQIVDELDDNGQLPQHTSALESALIDPDAPQGAPAQAVQQPQALNGDDVPDKYRGKNARELLDIIQNQESHIGKQGQELGTLRNEVGTLRGVVEQSLALRESGNTGHEEVGTEEDLSDDDFIINPRDAVSKTVKRQTQEANQRLARLEQQAAAIDFGRRHPTAQADLEDPRFIEFVQKSSRRQGLAQVAFKDQHNVDYGAADELWESWEEYKELTGSVTSSPETPSQEAASQAEPTKEAPALVSQGSSGETGGTSKPTYSQAALNRLQAENPDLYWANDTQAKIAEARREGRVLQDT